MPVSISAGVFSGLLFHQVVSCCCSTCQPCFCDKLASWGVIDTVECVVVVLKGPTVTKQFFAFWFCWLSSDYPHLLKRRCGANAHNKSMSSDSLLVIQTSRECLSFKRNFSEMQVFLRRVDFDFDTSLELRRQCGVDLGRDDVREHQSYIHSMIYQYM